MLLMLVPEAQLLLQHLPFLQREVLFQLQPRLPLHLLLQTSYRSLSLDESTLKVESVSPEKQYFSTEWILSRDYQAVKYQIRTGLISSRIWKKVLINLVLC